MLTGNFSFFALLAIGLRVASEKYRNARGEAGEDRDSAKLPIAIALSILLGPGSDL
jgi:hypothetical protein